jgi:hypothetical protein
MRPVVPCSCAIGVFLALGCCSQKKQGKHYDLWEVLASHICLLHARARRAGDSMFFTFVLPTAAL